MVHVTSVRTSVLPAVVNQSEKQQANLLVKELRQIVVVERFFNDKLHEKIDNSQT